VPHEDKRGVDVMQKLAQKNPAKKEFTNINKLLLKNAAFFNHVHIINQKFDILPDKRHYGMAIDYVDLKESREQFVRELVNTILDWVYSQAKQSFILTELKSEGRSNANANMELVQKAFEKFRKSDDGKLLHGQFGELLLANCLQYLFQAIPILRKMAIATSPAHERFGADAIHYATVDNAPIFYIGEAKCYTSTYSFNVAFEAAIKSILNEYDNITTEIRQYLHEDFLEPDIEQIATDLVNGKLKNARYRLVSIVAYEENSKKTGKTRAEIIKNIDAIIIEKYKKFDKKKFDIYNTPILDRITYIVFPVWEFDKLIEGFAKSIPNK
jgi:hypothetical protein